MIEKPDRPSGAAVEDQRNGPDFPRSGWIGILGRVLSATGEINASLLAAGVAFYAFLAIPSALTALVSFYGVIADPLEIQRQLTSMSGVVPQDALNLLLTELKSAAGEPAKLSIGLAFSLLIAVWSTHSGTSSLITAVNVAYKEPERRGFIKFQAVALVMTIGAIVFTVIALALVAVLPAVIGLLPLGDFGRTLLTVLRWPVLVVLIIVALATFYRFAPSQDRRKWRWISPGATTAGLLWIIACALFSLYVGQFASYNKTYGSLGSVVVLLLWLYITCFIIILGAALNAEIEHHTAPRASAGAGT